MEFLVPIYITTIGISFLVSLTSFRWNGPFHLKFFSVLLGITFFIEIAAVISYKVYGPGNSHIYNPFVLVEFCAYVFFFRKILANKKQLTVFILLVLLLSWLISTIWKFGFHSFNTYFVIIGSCCTVGLVVTYYAQILKSSEPVNLFKQPEFIIATGMLIFYTCTIAFLGSINYLYKNYESLAKAFLAVNRSLCVIMYSLFIYAYICQVKIKK